MFGKEVEDSFVSLPLPSNDVHKPVSFCNSIGTKSPTATMPANHDALAAAITNPDRRFRLRLASMFAGILADLAAAEHSVDAQWASIGAQAALNSFAVRWRFWKSRSRGLLPHGCHWRNRRRRLVCLKRH